MVANPLTKQFKGNIKSNQTFKEELDFLENNVPEALYGENEAFQLLDNVLEEINGPETFLMNYDSPIVKQINVNSFLDRDAGDNPNTWANNFITGLGVDFDRVETDGLANLVADLGRDAFGCYLPMHAFYNSNKTPWGIYLYPELIAERAKFLQKRRPHNISFEQYFVLYFYAVYRHELFHYQTERFSTKLEISFARPFFKPYESNVYSNLQFTKDWLEEALAEASVLESILVANRTKIGHEIIRDIYRFDLQFMPAGYRDYHCKTYGGPVEAHKFFAAQIIEAEIEPSHKSTSLFIVKGEFGADDRKVPVYIVTGLKSYIKRIQ